MTDAPTTRTIRVDLPMPLYRCLQVKASRPNNSTGPGSVTELATDIIRQYIRREVEIGESEKVTKEALRRLQAKMGGENMDDLIRHTYASADFREGMSAFLGKRAPKWTGT